MGYYWKAWEGHWGAQQTALSACQGRPWPGRLFCKRINTASLEVLFAAILSCYTNPMNDCLLLVLLIVPFCIFCSIFDFCQGKQFIYESIYFFLLVEVLGNWTQDLVRAEHEPYLWAVPSFLFLHFYSQHPKHLGLNIFLKRVKLIWRDFPHHRSSVRNTEEWGGDNRITCNLPDLHIPGLRTEPNKITDRDYFGAITFRIIFNRLWGLALL